MYKYTQEGIEEEEFIEAKSKIEDICREYEDKYNEDLGEDHENWE